MTIFAEPGGSTDSEITVTASVTATVTLEMTIGPPLTNVSQGSSILEVGARQWVLVKVDIADLAKGFSVDPTGYPVSMAITPGDPLPTDYQDAQWLSRAADPAGYYAMILTGPGGALVPGTGHSRVYVQVNAGGEILDGRCGTALIVE